MIIGYQLILIKVLTLNTGYRWNLIVVMTLIIRYELILIFVFSLININTHLSLMSPETAIILQREAEVIVLVEEGITLTFVGDSYFHKGNKYD